MHALRTMEGGTEIQDACAKDYGGGTEIQDACAKDCGGGLKYRTHAPRTMEGY
jgi:hypothetical protein